MELPHYLLTYRPVFFLDGNFLSHENIYEKYGLQINFLEYLSVRLAIPAEWKQFLHTEHQIAIASVPFLKIKGKRKKIDSIQCKDIYWEFIYLSNSEKPTAWQRWTENFNVNDEDWGKIHFLPFKCTFETRLQSFQFSFYIGSLLITPCCLSISSLNQSSAAFVKKRILFCIDFGYVNKSLVFGNCFNNGGIHVIPMR